MPQPQPQPFPPPVYEGLDFSALALRVSRFKDRANPILEEKNNLWRIACDTLAELTRDGRPAPAAKAAIASWLFRFVPRLATTEAALIRNLERKLQRYGKGESVADQRRQAAKTRRAPKLSQADRDELVMCAVFKHEGDLDPAWYQCVAGNTLSAEIIERYPHPKNKRGRCPRSIRRQVSKEIARMLIHHRGPRQARLNGPYMTRDWEGTFAGDWFSSDDITLPVYYYVPAEAGGFELTRGQFLPLIDCRSKRILDFVLIDGKSYNAAAIRSLINKAGARFGLPRKGFHFECGIWADAKLLGRGTALPWEDVEQTFADRLGLRILHSIPGNPRAKIVENVAGLFQDLLPGEPGYVGRNEITIKYERIQKAKRAVESGKVHPAEAGFRSAEEWFARLHELCAQYNAKPQQSEVFGGYMSPDDAWERLQLRNDAGAVVGLTKLPPELRYLLAAQCISVHVRRGRVRVPFSKCDYLVAGARLFDGENVIAWFDPESPETLCVTDHKKENPVCLPREISAPAYGALPEEFERASAAMREQNRFERTRYSQLSAKYMPPTRANITDQATLEVGRQMEATREAARDPSSPAAINLRGQERERYKKESIELEEQEKRLREFDSALDFL